MYMQVKLTSDEWYSRPRFDKEASKPRFDGSERVTRSNLSNDAGKVDSNFFCYAATVLSSHRNVLIFTQRVHKPT